MRLCCLLFLTVSYSTLLAQDSLLAKLSAEIRQKNVYESVKQEKIAACREKLVAIAPGDLENQFRYRSCLCELFKTFNYDSAFTNIQKLQKLAYDLNDSVKIAYAKNQLAFVLLSSGMFKETLDSLRDVSMQGMPDSIRVKYYFLMGRTYYDLVDFDQDQYFSKHYTRLGSAFLDSAKNLSALDSYNYLYYKSLRNLKNENNQEVLADLTRLLEYPSLSSPQIAIAASTLSYYYTSRDQDEKAIPLLVRAAIEDIHSATKETAAIFMLAEILYNKGDINHAYEFIQQAMDDATFYGARQRKVQVGSILPVIAAARLTNIEGQRKAWLVYSSVITLLTLTILGFVFIIFRQLKKRKAAEKALLESNKIKEEYIGYYFNVNSDYVSKIEAFKKSIEMKLMTKKLDSIQVTIDNLNVKKEREELYTSFDRIFLKLFPDFVTTFNSYFAEEDRIVLKEGQLMNTELRIFALIRMGIHDNEKIARILDYSINTIYNYKARVKGKSTVPNEQFEKRIMEIQAQ